MRSAKKKQLFNVLMVVLIAAIVFSGVMFAGGIRGWFSGGSAITVTDKLGSANIEREGIAYSLKNETGLTSDDIVETLDGSTMTLKMASPGSITLAESTQVVVRSVEDDNISIEIFAGEVFVSVDIQNVPLTLCIGDCIITAEKAVFSISALPGSQSVYVYSGSVAFAEDNLSGETAAQAGQAATLLADDSGETVCSLSAMEAAELNDFLIAQVRKTNDTWALCFTDEELNTVVADRQNEMIALEAQRRAHEEEQLAQGGNVVVPIETNAEEKDTDTKEDSSTEGVSSGGSSPNGSVSNGQSAGFEPSDEQTEPSGGQTPEPSATPKPTATPAPTKAPEIYTCTIAIHCDTILENMDNLTEGKGQYVPANGSILATSSVQFYEDETVFDVLKRACKAAGIQIEYSYFPVYESYYIEGINHLYEFDCGAESGWMYKVNGWFPNYGCSAYELEDSDTIVWCYTCSGLGADVGGSVY